MNVWKRVQRVGKHAAKFQFVLSFHELTLECTKGTWKPTKLAIAITRRNRKYLSQSHDWEPTIKNPFRGTVVWTTPECLEFVTTLYKDSRAHEYEDKEWMIVIEEIEPMGRRRAIASINVNLKHYGHIEPSKTHLTLRMKPTSRKVSEASLNVTFASTLLKEGKATDEDMQSLASLMSLQQQHLNDIGNLADFDDESPAGTLRRKQTNQKISDLASSFGILNSDSAASINNSPYSLDASARDDASKTPTRPGSLQLEQEKTPKPHRETNGSVQNHWLGSEPISERSSESNKQSSSSHTIDPNAMLDDLLTWCQDVTKNSRGVKITNFTTSFRNGLAFCAIIHHFHPDLVDFASLSPVDIETNCRLAFDVAAKLGVSKLINPKDMLMRQTPERIVDLKIAVMTYLHELRTHFTGERLEIGKMDRNAKEVTYTPVTPSDPLKRAGFKSRLFSEKSPPSQHSSTIKENGVILNESSTSTHYPSSPKDKSNPLKFLSKQSSKQSPKRVVSPTSDGQPLMTRQQLSDPFHEMDNENVKAESPVQYSVKALHKTNSFSPPAGTPLSPGRSIRESPAEPKSLQTSPSRDEVLLSRARELIEQARSQSSSLNSSPSTDLSPEELDRRKELHERAKRIIDSVKQSGPGSPVSVPITPVSMATRARSPSASIQFYQFRKKLLGEVTSAQSTLSRGSSQRSSPQRTGSFRLPPRSASDESKLSTSDGAAGNNVLQTAAKPKQNGTPATQGDVWKLQSSPDEPSSKSSQPKSTASVKSEPVKTTDDDLDEVKDIQEEIARLEYEQRLIDDTAAQVETRLREAMKPGAIETEEDILKEWFPLVNKRNAIVRRLDQLNNMEKESDLESRYDKLNNELRTLMSLLDWQKTDAHRRREQMLMAEMLELVKQRDEVVQQLDEQEKAIEEDNKVAQTVISHLQKEQEGSFFRFGSFRKFFQP